MCVYNFLEKNHYPARLLIKWKLFLIGYFFSKHLSIIKVYRINIIIYYSKLFYFVTTKLKK